LAPRLAEHGVEKIEQTLPAGADDQLAAAPRPETLCADESCHDRASLPGLAAKYDMINIKLDKTGGLTEALSLRDAALAEGLAIMVGCMVGTSLAMAPACLVAQGAAIVDLDGPLLLKEDRQPGLVFDGSQVTPPAAELWG
ncbi:MAG: enolase C-terminal domain-like protein, partial [Pseudomonadota bacterium]|nr:enolase C-terminal domain-like protein [Pseudomonadota bacterium]